MTGGPEERDPLRELVDDAAHAAAVRARVEERERRARAAEVATWIGTLRDLAERGVPVVVSGRSGRVHRGAVTAVARDHLALQSPSGAVVLVALSAVRLVRPEPDVAAPAAAGDREAAQDRTLLEALGRVADDRGEVAIHLADVAEGLQGQVLGFGEDVLTLRLTGGGRGTVYVPAAAIEEVLWAPPD